jgi:chromosome segregation ATPase
MADLQPLIRLHKYQLDEKRRALAALYSDMALLEQRRRKLEDEYTREKEAVEKSGDIHFTFAGYAKGVQLQRDDIESAETELEKRIETAKDDMMETFSELKKYEMTQAERDRLEEEERRIREGLLMDEIGLEGYRRRDDA